MEQRTGSQLGKEYVKAVYCHPAYWAYMQSTPCKMMGWIIPQAGIKTARGNINNLRYADDSTLMSEREEELKESLDEGERGEWKSWLKIQHSEN